MQQNTRKSWFQSVLLYFGSVLWYFVVFLLQLPAGGWAKPRLQRLADCTCGHAFGAATSSRSDTRHRWHWRGPSSAGRFILLARRGGVFMHKIYHHQNLHIPQNTPKIQQHTQSKYYKIYPTHTMNTTKDNQNTTKHVETMISVNFVVFWWTS